MTDASEESRPRFEATEAPGLRIVDPIEAADFRLGTDRPVDPSAADPERFHFPVDAATAVDASAVEFPHMVYFIVRDREGEHVAEVPGHEERRLQSGAYTVELSKAPIKLYLQVTGPATLRVLNDRAVIQFPESTRCRLGARSYHQRPAGTVTTTAAPEDIAAAVSQFGSALKTRSPERSWPTLRGHPPLVELGDDLVVPDAVEATDSGVSVVVPESYDALFAVAPLAFYLDATVRVGTEPRLRADGRSWPLPDGRGFERAVADLLRRHLTLDCIVRTEGYYDYDLYERARTVDALPFDPEWAYDQPLDARVAAYMDVPRAAIEPTVPRWKRTVDVVPEPAHVGALPHLVDDLAVVRCPTQATLADPTPDGSGAHVVSTEEETPAHADEGLVRSLDDHATTDFVYPPAAPSLEHGYVGPGVPVGASKLSVDAYERQLDREPRDDIETSVTVVTNDDRMDEGDTVADIYALGELDAFDVTVHADTTRAELRQVIRSETDCFHYVGHVDDRGFACSDGRLDAATVETVGVSAFFLNACASFEQGQALVDGGAIGGIATVQRVFDAVADTVGETVARLLGQGFTLVGALELCTRTTGFPTEKYLVLGDGTAQIATPENGIALGYEVATDGDDGLVVTPFAYPTDGTPPGTTVQPLASENARHFLAAGDGFEIETTLASFVEAIGVDPCPVVVDGDLHWSADLDRTTLAAALGRDHAE